MGFGDLIDFPINEVPTKLAFYVVDSLDVEGMILRLPTGNLQISPQTVKMVLGLPRGLRRLEGEREKNDLFEQEWKDQYKDEKKLTTYAISKEISKTTNIDFIFRMNFLMLVANTLGECDNNYVVKTTVLENILEEDDVSEIDWCSFVYECARLSKKDWATRKRDRTEVVYYGPVTFLMFGNDQRLNQYRERLNQIFTKPNGSFKQRSPFCSSSTDSSYINFETSDDEDDNNVDGNAKCTDEYREHGDENGESMIVDDDVSEKHEDLKGNGNDPDAANNNSNIMDDGSGNNEVGGNKDVNRSKNDECVENNEVSSREKDEVLGNNEGAYSGKSKEHNFEFTPGSQPTFDLGFDSPVAVSKPSKKTESNDEEKEYRCLQSPYMYEKNKPESMETKIEKQYEEFAKMIVIQMEDDISKLQFDDVNLNGVFAKHLSTYLHPKAEKYMNQKKKPTILNMKWKTKKEKIDCGLFMMMHMDNYEGKIKWETGMLEETNKNHRLQRNNLRAKYAAKMMLHEINENQKLMSDYELKFAAENPDEKEADKIVNQSIMKKIAEQDNQGK
ncbi:hypothetical protein CTI12_AA309800 [Artemisia annua]|uniref:Ulp1 protease family, C-terminal catalytic domain-containing protein n=1 Tax=Artemisia annua TaxID=35608 RepID=A0A2U1N736_ARTAN|nr:hypothetical protein CTI12_AA309800 [Artemisia annua]